MSMWTCDGFSSDWGMKLLYRAYMKSRNPVWTVTKIITIVLGIRILAILTEEGQQEKLKKRREILVNHCCCGTITIQLLDNTNSCISKAFLQICMYVCGINCFLNQLHWGMIVAGDSCWKIKGINMWQHNHCRNKQISKGLMLKKTLG